MSNAKIRFGPAGACEVYHGRYRDLRSMPEFLVDNGLDAFEYQCGRGVNVNEEFAFLFKEKCEAVDIQVSLHAPYYISLSGVVEEKRYKSIDYILQSAAAVKMLGGNRIIVHAGSASKISRAEAVALAADTLARAQLALDERGFSDVSICPETMGKVNQLGTVAEVCELCGVSERFLPCVDFGHVNSMTNGSLGGKADFDRVVSVIENALGSERTRKMHIHFSKIEYTEKGGEQRHLTFEDQVFGPHFPPLAELLYERGMTPVVICESAGTQTADAVAMREMYGRLRENR